jgi:hypothetical protein
VDLKLADLAANRVLTKRRLELSKRLDDVRKLDHDAFCFFDENAAVVAALVVASGHINPHASFLRSDECLLACPTTSATFEKLTEEEVSNGVYLTWDAIRRVWVRAGKVNRSGGGGARLAEHHADAKKVGTDHRLHQLYPDEKVFDPRAGAKGTHQQLRWFWGMCFNSSSDVVCVLTDQGAGGLFTWSATAMSAVRRATIPGARTVADKQVHLVSYSLELFYDLLLAPASNVSRSPGFEAFIGQFGRTL